MAPSEASKRVWLVDGAYMTGRVGIGAEVLRSGLAVGVPQPLNPTDEQYDLLLAGTVRLRMFTGALARIDAVAALGAAVQRRTTDTLYCFVRCLRSVQMNTDTTLLTGVGLDIPVAVAPNVDVVGVVRVYAYERPGAALAQANGEWEGRPMVGVAGRFRW